MLDDLYAASILLTLAALSAGCENTAYPYRMEMMPPPAIHRSGVVAVPDIQHRELVDGIVQLPYATLRESASENDAEPFYVSRRGSVLRLGLADVHAEKDKGAAAPRIPTSRPTRNRCS